MVWPLIFDKFEQSDELVINPIEDLTFDEYSYLMDKMRGENLKEAMDIIPSQKANWMKYIINVLSDLYADYKKAKH